MKLRPLEMVALGLGLFAAASALAGKRRLSLAEMTELARKTGFPDPELAAAVAMAESGGVVTAVNQKTGDYGLWQINLRSHPEFAAVGIFNPEINARAAFKISKGGTVWTDWVAFKSGDFQRWYPGS